MSKEPQGLDWLKELEARVKAAAQEIRRLRGEGAKLRARIEELEAEAKRRDSGADWLEERNEIRQRVERLVEHLEELSEAATERA